MPLLAQTQINTLQGNLDSGDTAAFYANLQSYGDPYGTLGLQVTQNSGWQGQIANGFAASAAENNDVVLTYDSTAWRNLNRDLADRYLQEIRDNNGNTPDHSAIKRIHNDAYRNANLDPNDWFPNLMLENSDDPAALWNDWMSNNGLMDIADDAFDIAGTALGPNLEFFSKIGDTPILSLPSLVPPAEDYINAGEFSKNFLKGLAALDTNGRNQLLNDLFSRRSLINAILPYVDDIAKVLGAVVDGYDDLFASHPIKSLSWRDPNIRTFDGVRYSPQDPGEFVYAKSKTDGFEVQTRHSLFRGSNRVSVNTATAVRLTDGAAPLWRESRF